MTYCPHDDDPALCPPCQDAGKPPPQKVDRNWSLPFDARYAGRCEGCDFPIAVGQAIRVGDDDDRRVYVHDDPGCVEATS